MHPAELRHKHRASAGNYCVGCYQQDQELYGWLPAKKEYPCDVILALDTYEHVIERLIRERDRLSSIENPTATHSTPVLIDYLTYILEGVR